MDVDLRQQSNLTVIEERGLPRSLEVILAAFGLVALAPALALAALAVKLSSPGPILFRQERVGQGGKPFRLQKFRTMRHASSGLGVTAGDDARITRVGKLLRRTKLDELPELWNVLRGDMALVGPRPEIRAYVRLEDPLWQDVLRARPGLTDPIAIHLRDEEEVLARVDGDRQRFYLEFLQPYKLLGSADYLRRRTTQSDLCLLFETALAALRLKRSQTPTVAKIEAAVLEYRQLSRKERPE